MKAIVNCRMDRILITEYPPIAFQAFHRVKTIAKCDIFRQIFGKIHNDYIYLKAKFNPNWAILVFHKKKLVDECLNREDNRFLHRRSRFAIANTPYFYSNELKFSDFKRTSPFVFCISVMLVPVYLIAGATLQRSNNSGSRRLSKQAEVNFKMIFPLCDTILPAISMSFLRTVLAYEPTAITDELTSSLKDSSKKWPISIV